MAGANRIHHPRKGSMQFWHRVRAKRIYPRINNWPKIDATKLLGFIGEVWGREGNIQNGRRE